MESWQVTAFLPPPPPRNKSDETQWKYMILFGLVENLLKQDVRFSSVARRLWQSDVIPMYEILKLPGLQQAKANIEAYYGTRVGMEEAVRTVIRESGLPLELVGNGVRANIRIPALVERLKAVRGRPEERMTLRALTNRVARIVPEPLPLPQDRPSMLDFAMIPQDDSILDYGVLPPLKQTIREPSYYLARAGLRPLPEIDLLTGGSQVEVVGETPHRLILQGGRVVGVEMQPHEFEPVSEH